MLISERVIEHLNGFFIASLLSLITGSIAWQKGFFQMPSPFYTPIKGREVLRGFLFFLIAQIIIVPSLITVFTHGDIRNQGWTSIWTVLGGFAGVWFAVLTLSPHQRHLMWGHSNFWYRDLFVGILTWFVSYPFVLAVGQLISIPVLLIFQEPQVDQVAVKYLKQSLGNPPLFWAVVLCVIVVVPVVEEILFRGLLQSWLKEKLATSIWAIIATSFIFAAFHYSDSQGATNIEFLASLFILSCFLGFIYERQRSLWAPIGLHAFFNMISVIMVITTEAV